MIRRPENALKKPPPRTRKVRREQGVFFGQGNKIRLVLTLLHQRNGNRRREKADVGVEKNRDVQLMYDVKSEMQ